MEPPGAAVSVPSLTTAPARSFAALRVRCPVRGFQLVKSKELATKAPTLTCEERPNTIPFGLIRTIMPFASRRPNIWLGLWSKMRLSATAEEVGCMKRTSSPLVMLKLFQSSRSCLEVWSIRVVEEFGLLMVPCPPTTTPPVGPARQESAPKVMTAAIPPITTRGASPRTQ